MFTDDFLRYTCVYFMENKSDVLECFIKFKSAAENKTNQKIKTLRSDNRKEFVNKAFDKFLEEHRIKRQLTVPYTPQKNGVAERKNQTTSTLLDFCYSTQIYRRDFGPRQSNGCLFK